MVRPVDLQDNLSKTQLLEKIQQIQKSSPEEAQKQFAQEMQKKAVNSKSKVNDLPKTDEITIHRDEKQKKSKQENDQKQDKKNKQNKSHDGQDEHSQNVDYLA